MNAPVRNQGRDRFIKIPSLIRFVPSAINFGVVVLVDCVNEEAVLENVVTGKLVAVETLGYSAVRPGTPYELVHREAPYEVPGPVLGQVIAYATCGRFAPEPDLIYGHTWCYESELPPELHSDRKYWRQTASE
ncbi:MAG TPA: hypothetical protein VGE35_00660 [Candidatus Paceibacterota bacterium]